MGSEFTGMIQKMSQSEKAELLIEVSSYLTNEEIARALVEQLDAEDVQGILDAIEAECKK